MTRLARSERAALCDLALQVGEDQPTLCEGWTVKDLVVHLLVREGSPAAVGISVPLLSRLTDAASARLGRRSFASLVDRLRDGPPRLSPFAVPRLDDLANTLEFYVHHEDVRRAQPGWTPRDLGAEADRRLWSMLGLPGKALAHRAKVGLRIEDSSTGESKALADRAPSATVRGRPGEVAMFLFGRADRAEVELLGDDEAVRRLRATSQGG